MEGYDGERSPGEGELSLGDACAGEEAAEEADKVEVAPEVEREQ